jgi:CheY-like chemotaxis protein
MLVDDDEATNFLHRRVIDREELDVQVKILHNAREALGYLNDAELPQPCIIFLDLNMPGMNGWDFLEHYKHVPLSRRHDVVLYILTTSLNPDDEKRAQNYPELNGFLRKPLTPEKLHRVLRKHFPDYSQDGATSV